MASPIASVAALDIAVDPACATGGLAAMQGRTRYGSAFLFDAAGHLVTNRHVVNGASAITVRFADGSRRPARIVGADERTDVAVLAVEAGDLPPPLKMRTERPPVGERVEAIGTPFGYSFSVSAGIVSGHDRVLDPLEPFGFLQHDAAINPGSSGGPLVDGLGRVVGMNTATPNGTLRDVGVALAVPAPVVAAVAGEIVREGSIARAGLGLFGRSVDPAFAAALGRDGLSGVAVESVRPGGAADTAGLRPGDIVVRGGDAAIADVHSLARWLADRRAGERATLSVLRDAQALDVAVTLDAAPSPLCGSLAAGRQSPARQPFGVSGLSFERDVPRIAAVLARSPADRAGLAPGDRVLAIGAASVATGAAAEQALGRAMGGRLALLVARKGEPSRYVVLDRDADPAGETARGNAAGGEVGEL